MNKIFLSLILILFLSGSFSFQALAGPGKIIPFLSLKQEYSDNITFSSSNETEDFITTLAGGAVASYKSERVNAQLLGRLFHLFYWDNDILDATDGAANAAIKYQMTERFSFGASADFRQDSRKDTDTNSTGLILTGDREQANFSISASSVFSETMMGEVRGAYGLVDVDELNEDESNNSYQLDFSLSKNLSKTFKNTTGLLNFSYLHYTSDYESYSPNSPIVGANTKNYYDYDSDVFQMTIGVSRLITELYSTYFQIGASYTDTTESQRIVYSGSLAGDITQPDYDNSSVGGVLATGLNYDGLYWDMGVSISHDIRGSSGSNGTVERSAVSFDVDRKVTDEFSLSFAASCFLNQNERNTRPDLEDLTINLQPGFKYRFWDTFVLSGVYRFTTVDDRQDNTSSERNLVYLLLKKNFEL